MSDDIKNWDQRLLDQEKRGWDNYLRRRIHLDNARDLGLMAIAGEFIYVEKVSSESARATVRINRNNNDAIDLDLGTIIKTVFVKFYVTNEAQAGEWIDLIIGINFEYYKENISKEEAQPAITLTNVAADTNTVAAAHICNSVLIRAFTTNTGLVWVNFGAAAVENACYPLDTGDAISVKCSNTNRINALFKVANEDLAIIYQV